MNSFSKMKETVTPIINVSEILDEEVPVLKIKFPKYRSKFFQCSGPLFGGPNNLTLIKQNRYESHTVI